jgi:hypothetical protein
VFSLVGPVTHRFDRSGVSAYGRRASCDVQAGGGFGELPGQDAKRAGMGPAVVLGQDLAEAAGPIGDRAVADLAACDRKMGNGDGEAARL